MENDKNLEKQADALEEEDLDSVAGGMIKKTYGNPPCPKCKCSMLIVEKDGGKVYKCPKCGDEEWVTITLQGCP